MIYTQHNPHPALANYIDAYWTVTGDREASKTEKILPDGCVDIIFNFGGDCETDNGNLILRNEKVYLVGTMTCCKNTRMNPETKLLGIRFKPAAFSAFYKFTSLHEIKDITVEFEKALSPDLQKTIQSSTDYLDHFFVNKLSKRNPILLPVIADIQNHKGQMDINTLAQRHCTTVRQLERSFRQQVGISPKEFMNIVRYQHTLPLILNRSSNNRSLLDIAFSCGYYDHAHLTNEIKRYTGIAPSQL